METKPDLINLDCKGHVAYIQVVSQAKSHLTCMYNLKVEFPSIPTRHSGRKASYTHC